MGRHRRGYGVVAGVLVMRRLALTLFLLAAPAVAADRHVFRDTDADDKLNQCPNPTHNTYAVPSTANLQYCPAGSNIGKVLGDKTGYVASCPSSAATDIPETGVTADIDGDGTTEAIHGHPQACVYRMAKSDSCEVHAGRYATPGAICADDCSTSTQMRDYNHYLASVLAYGFFSDGHTDGYGTSASPGYLRGAVMGGSTDTWDANGDKEPDASQTNAVIISGDFAANGDTTYTTTTCSGGSCSGDGFPAVWVGCNNGAGSYNFECNSGMHFVGRVGPKLDTDANGTFDTEIGVASGPNTNYLTIKDIKFVGYNTGNGSTDGNARHKQAPINLNGNENTDGLKVDHVWMTDNKAVTTGGELWWALIADMRNNGCVDYTEVKNSLLNQQNRFVFNTDGSAAAANGCSWNIHDNRITVNTPSTVLGTPAVGYFKNLDRHDDGRAYRVKFWNNEVIVHDYDSTSNNGWLFDLQHFGNSGGSGLGEIWIYGNLIRSAASGLTSTFQFLYPTACSEEANQTDSGRVYVFNNTVDGWSGGGSINVEQWCNDVSAYGTELLVEKNNVWLNATQENTTTVAGTITRANEFNTDAAKCTPTTGYFTCGTTPGDYNAYTYYAPIASGALDGLTANNACDPDSNGRAGINPDGLPSTDITTWTDIAGNTIVCDDLADAIDAGAIQSGGAAPPASTGTLKGATLRGGTVR